MMNKSICLIICVMLCSCSRMYTPIRITGEKKQLRTREQTIRRISARLDSASLREALELMPYEMNVVYENNSFDKPVTLDAVEMPIDEYMYACARSAGVEVERHGTIWIFRSEGEEKQKGTPLRAGMEMKSSGLFASSFTAWVDLSGWSQEELSKMITDGSLTWIAGDKYKFSGDLRSCIDMYEAVDIMRNSSRCQYAFEMICLTRDLEMKAGIEEDLGLNWDWRKQFSKGMQLTEWSVISKVAANASASSSQNKSAMVVSGVMREGVEFRTNIGNQIPYIKRSVSDSGTVSDTSVEYLDIGVTVTLQIQGAALGICKFNLDQTEVNGYLNGYPIRHRSHLETVLHVEDEDMRYVGSFYKNSKQRRLLFMSDDVSQWDVYLRVLRIDRGQKAEKSTKELEDFTKSEKN